MRSLLNKCSLCRWLDSPAFSLPPAPPLPAYRLEIAPPFSNVGFDHMGPLWVYDVFNRTKLNKVYVALFTCCVTRMIHLELQPSLDAPVCIRSIKRTFARVGWAKLLISDNHKTINKITTIRRQQFNRMEVHPRIVTTLGWVLRTSKSARQKCSSENTTEITLIIRGGRNNTHRNRRGPQLTASYIRR